jgi:hypothetical protein
MHNESMCNDDMNKRCEDNTDGTSTIRLAPRCETVAVRVQEEHCRIGFVSSSTAYAASRDLRRRVDTTDVSRPSFGPRGHYVIADARPPGPARIRVAPRPQPRSSITKCILPQLQL